MSIESTHEKRKSMRHRAPTRERTLTLADAIVVAHHPTPARPEALDELLNTMIPVIQVKGWGSGIARADYDAFGVPDPNEELVGFEWMVTSMIHRDISRFMNGEKEVIVQWDGDKIASEKGFSTYGVFLHAVLRACSFLGIRVRAVVCTKLTTAEKAPKFSAKWGEIGAEALCDEFQVPGFSVAFPLEDDAMVKQEQKSTGYGFFGSQMNQMMRNPKLILAFGGGDVLTAEEREGFSNTTIRAWSITRKGGDESSAFATKHARRSRTHGSSSQV